MKSEADDLLAQADIAVEETKKLIINARRKRIKVATFKTNYDALAERLEGAKESMKNDDIK